MKIQYFFLFLLLFSNLQAQPKDVVLRLFSSTDQKDWGTAKDCFADSVTLDYSSMGSPKAILTPPQIINIWKTILPGFTNTHHQLGNIKETIGNKHAKVFAYGTATHYLEDVKGNVWTVVGTYTIDLTKQKDVWKINKMVFDMKYQDGNIDLPQKAMANVAEIQHTTSTEQNKNAVITFLNSLENKDMEALMDLFAEEGRQTNPYHSNLFPNGAVGKEALRNYWAPVFSNVDRMEFPVEELHAMENPDLIFVKFKGNVQLKHKEDTYQNSYYATFKFNDDGKITEYVEIFNPITAAKSFGLINQLK